MRTICWILLVALELVVLARGARRWESAEHQAAGNVGQITLLALPGDEDENNGISNPNNEVMFFNVSASNFTFRNGANTNLGTYGDVTALAGDWFGGRNEDEVICFGSTPEDQLDRARKVFDRYWTDDSDDIEDIIDEIDDEREKLNEHGFNNTWEVYDDLPELRWQDEVIREVIFARWNVDHFLDQECAETAYIAFHNLSAGNTSEAASKLDNFTSMTDDEKKDALRDARKQLELAYVLQAFGDHFLEDSFSAGHTRVPRSALRDLCEDSFDLETTEGTMTRWQHDEDNRNGLFMANKNNETWFGFGDSRYFEPGNAENRQRVEQAVETSRGFVMQEFNGTQTDPNEVLDTIPDPSQFDRDDLRLENVCPLWKVDANGTLLTRSGAPRPPAWVANNTGQGGNESLDCDYVVATEDMCPKGFKLYWQNAMSDQGLEFNDTYDAWVTSRLEIDGVSALLPSLMLIAVGGMVISA